jgi:ABC-2 type transport system permease protein
VSAVPPDRPGRSDALRSVRLVASREVSQRIRSRAFLIATALLCALIVAGGVIDAVVVGEDGPPSYGVVLVGDAPAGLVDALDAAADELGIELAVTSMTTRAAADEAVRDGDASAAIDGDAAELVARGEPPVDLAAAIDLAWRFTGANEAATAAGLSADEALAILSPDPLSPVALEQPREQNQVGQAVGTVIGVLLFLSINLFGSYVLMGVIEEKSTGVIEVLLAQLRPRHLLAGKVLGIGAVAMVQMIAIVIAGLVALRISGVTVPGIVWVAIPSSLFWFVGGFVLYNTLFAVAGSMVSRVEDAQSATAPITVVFLGAYMAVFVLGSDTGSTAATVLSLLPPFAPLMMPLRIATDTATWWQVVVAAVLLIAAAVWMLRLAGAIYARTLLHRGARLGWRDALASRTTTGMP